MRSTKLVGALAVAIALAFSPVLHAQELVLPPDLSTTSATPIEIPGQGVKMGMPIPIPGNRIDRIDPRVNPEFFMGLPIPISGPTGFIGRMDYLLLNDGGVLGNTPFGYARFFSYEDYTRFLRLHPPTR